MPLDRTILDTALGVARVALGDARAALTSLEAGLTEAESPNSVTYTADPPPPPPPNSAPTASFVFTTPEPLVAYFDSTASADSDGVIVNQDWSFGDGTSGTGATVSHTYGVGGDYTVTLTVVDDLGATGTFTLDVTVTDPAPEPEPVDYTPKNAYLRANADRTVEVFADANPAIVRWYFKEAKTAGYLSPTTVFTAPYRKSPVVAIGNYSYQIIGEDAQGVLWPSANMPVYVDGTVRTVQAGTAAPSPGLPPDGALPTWAQLAEQHEAALVSGYDIEAMYRWHLEHILPRRRPTNGSVPAFTVRTQAEADSLVGKRLTTNRLYLEGNFYLHDVELYGIDCYARKNAVVDLENISFNGAGNTSLTGLLTIHENAQVTGRGLEFVGAYDGVRSHSGPANRIDFGLYHKRALSNPQNHHQDIVQIMKGSIRLDRWFMDGTGLNTSCMLVKPDAGAITSAELNRSVVKNNTLRAHDNNSRTIIPRNVDFSGNLVSSPSPDSILDVWNLGEPTRSAILSQQVHIPGGALRTLKHHTNSL